MIKKIKEEINDFTNDIKDVQNATKLLEYMNKGVYSSIQLLMAVSKSFSVLGRVFMFFIVFITGLIMLTSVGATPFNVGYLIFIDIVLFILILRLITKLKRQLFSNIDEKRIEIIQAQSPAKSSEE